MTCTKPSLMKEYLEYRVGEMLAGRSVSLEELCSECGLSIVDQDLEDAESLLDLWRAEIVVNPRLPGHDREHTLATALGHAMLHRAELVAGVTLGEAHTEEAENFADDLLARFENPNRTVT